MKKYIYKTKNLLAGTIVLIVLLSSCEKWIDTNLNIDPDAPADVPMNLMLPAIQQALGYNMVGNDLVRTTNIWMQQFDGVDRQSFTEARYQLMPADVNNIWNSFYTSIFMNSKVLVNKAENTEGKESPYNAGVGRVIIATTLGIATDLFGDMPFSQAFRGNENVLKPAFDTQQEIYDTLFTILDKAIQNFNVPVSENLVSVGGDVIYGGDIDLWRKAAYSVKARHLMQLGLVNGNAAYTAALTAAAEGFESSDDDFIVPWDTDNKNPIFQFMEQRTDIRMGARLVDMLKAAADPRLPFYAERDGAGEYTGSIAGSENDLASRPGRYVAAFNANSVVMSFAELKFIEAEAQFRLGQTPLAQAAYEEAVAASLLKVTGNENTEWLEDNIIDDPVTLEKILTQKYIATFGTTRAYADYRRTGLPAMSLPIGAVLQAMPNRYPYAQEEITYNKENVPTVTLNDLLWWDR
jgi:hypothetical protein